MSNTIYLRDSHKGWIINLLVGGIEVISPALGKLEIVQTCSNAVAIIETTNAEEEKDDHTSR